MPSPTMSTSPGSPAAPRHRDRDRASSSVDRSAPFHSPSRARKVRWIASGVPSTPFVTSATIAGQMPPEGCFRPVWKRTDWRQRNGDPTRAKIGCRPAFPRPVSMPARWQAPPACAARRHDRCRNAAPECLACGAIGRCIGLRSPISRAPEAPRSPHAGHIRHGIARAHCRPWHRRSRGWVRDPHAPGNAPSSRRRPPPAEGPGDGFSFHGSPLGAGVRLGTDSRILLRGLVRGRN